MPRVAILLMGPTASGKTALAVSLCKRFPLDIVSVDSALVYRGMDIGTAKPEAAVLRRTPHRLVDIRDPEDSYSAGDFVRDATIEIEDILAAGRIPLLVGGTMMYFRALTAGLAELPSADPGVRAALEAEAASLGWPALHARLAAVDPVAGRRIEPTDSQRIQRALEVYTVSGRPLSAWHADPPRRPGHEELGFVRLALWPSERAGLHERVEKRLKLMIKGGFLGEVRELARRPGLTREHPSMRAVGYRQLWAHLAGECSLEAATDRALAATRQLAKRQLTWLRADASLERYDPFESALAERISRRIGATIAD